MNKYQYIIQIVGLASVRGEVEVYYHTEAWAKAVEHTRTLLNAGKIVRSVEVKRVPVPSDQPELF